MKSPESLREDLRAHLKVEVMEKMPKATKEDIEAATQKLLEQREKEMEQYRNLEAQTQEDVDRQRKALEEGIRDYKGLEGKE